MDSQRKKRRKEIQAALNFIQSSLAYPDREGYKDFLINLVISLLEEGNSWFRDGHWEQAVGELSEGLNVCHYVSGEGFHIPHYLLESLYVNRATAYHSMKEYDNCMKDCDKALEVCKKSPKVLYLKALCLKQLGKYHEAYDCTRDCLLSAHQDKRVNELAEELANHLGLEKRKPYVSYHVGNVTNPLSKIAPVNFPSVSQCVLPNKANDGKQSAASVLDSPDPLEDCELIGDDLDNLLDCVPNEHLAAEVHTQGAASLPSVASSFPPTVPTPHLPPAFLSSSMSGINSTSSLSLGGQNSLDTLDDLSSPHCGLHFLDNLPGGVNGARLKSPVLDSLDDLLVAAPRAVSREAPQPKTERLEKPFSDFFKPLQLTCDPSAQLGSALGVTQPHSLDSLDLFPAVKGQVHSEPALVQKGIGLDSLSDFSSAATQTPVPNPLSATHDFMQACSSCFAREGRATYTFIHKPDLRHSCNRDILLCRRKGVFPSEWTKVRHPPTWTSITGPFVLCKHVLQPADLGLCRFGETCHFAFNQLEIDVWTEERKGTLDRNLLFGPSGVATGDPVNSIRGLLREHKGTFLFLCQECYHGKPRVISERCRDDHAVCSNAVARHSFDANKCLAFEVTATNCNYRKVRPFNILAHLKLCSQKVHDGCPGEYRCVNAHSVIELRTWRVQRDTGITADEIVKVSKKYHEEQEQNTGTERKLRSSGVPAATNGEETPKGKSLNLKMKFVCAVCLQDGHISMPNNTLKYCSAKAKHPWTKEQNTLLVKSPEKSNWVPVRPLPHTNNFPAQYELCTWMLKNKKCDFTGNCSFAHSTEEKDMWMYMKTQNVVEMQQIYNMWLTLSTHSRKADKAVSTREKDIVMPTDDAEPTSGFDCPLCGKHSNSERQWQRHISSTKHKERLFSCEGEDEALKWTHRFPGVSFERCAKSEADCPDGASCEFAHSPEELQEWIERREFLRRKLAQAREDNLIMPDEVDFGKYNFILQI
ncbi:zinc finger CCCH domain-containing protein 7B-like isoform X2 [Hippocampus zosterae]|uniref:zinc finger CCCH domain-containing protein 7B-like isoform X2 n=1 Tax=Hippocampus zosterae TaxID=109293 RepID=UPI00223D64B4|nr:zinc finger CCCH domain-containing protein 7B-like isoform X2 [Hippocampus zosterae]